MFWKVLIISMVFYIFSACNPDSPRSQNSTPLQKACNFLWSKQSDDGGWHSETHGILKGGESLTAYILWTLLEVPEKSYKKPAKQVEKGLDFIRKHIDENGVLGLSDEYVMDYPNYATSYALRLLSKYGTEQDADLIANMKQYLLSQQFTQQRGIPPTHPAHGAWGFGEDLKDGSTGQVDLSHTRRVLQALKAAGVKADSAFLKARDFLSLLQKHPSEKRLQPNAVAATNIPYDGGFYASSVTFGMNKGGVINNDSSSYYASYATATCDGILALLACGFSKNDEPLEAAANWLLEHPEIKYPEGMDENDPGQWQLVMVFYHLAARTEAYRALEIEGEWSSDIRTFITEKQREDGSFSNPDGAPNKEDDPLLATAFAIIALAG